MHRYLEAVTTRSYTECDIRGGSGTATKCFSHLDPCKLGIEVNSPMGSPHLVLIRRPWALVLPVVLPFWSWLAGLGRWFSHWFSHFGTG